MNTKLSQTLHTRPLAASSSHVIVPVTHWQSWGCGSQPCTFNSRLSLVRPPPRQPMTRSKAPAATNPPPPHDHDPSRHPMISITHRDAPRPLPAARPELRLGPSGSEVTSHRTVGALGRPCAAPGRFRGPPNPWPTVRSPPAVSHTGCRAPTRLPVHQDRRDCRLKRFEKHFKLFTDYCAGAPQVHSPSSAECHALQCCVRVGGSGVRSLAGPARERGRER